MTDGDTPGDTLPERTALTRGVAWLLLGADRRVVAGLLSAIVWLAVLAVGLAHPTPADVLLTRGDPVETLFQGLLTATVTAVTLVLTLSQLVLSQELGALADQRNRMEGAMDFRVAVADAIDADVSPAEPASFLASLVGASRKRAEAVRAAVGDGEPAAGDPLDAYLDSVIDNAAAVTDRLDDAEFGTFEVVRAALDYNYSWKIHAGRRLLAEHGDALSTDARAALTELIETLELFGPAREHFKTLYFQWELSNLSLTILIVALPALAVAVTTLVFFDPGLVRGTTLGVDHALVVLATATTITVVPFTVLLSYILRVVTVTKRTLSIGPFILRETDRDVAVDWE